jgi:hypothetical protein
MFVKQRIAGAKLARDVARAAVCRSVSDAALFSITGENKAQKQCRRGAIR